ncbi:antibiotic biosynthesis monooxygenase [Mucilaginibacter sp. HC2]|nr:antibiotic biosynthesis monooxygenase [Mucilaginibacter inviolabilis]
MVFIDKFVIPQNGKQEFTERMNFNRDFIKNLPGFLGDAAYERIDENGNMICITIANWESEEALNQAKLKVQAEYQRIDFNPAELLSRLNITMVRAVFQPVAN